MSLELIHTSAPRGLHTDSSGFCTVSMTSGMPAPLEARLAALGGYRPHGGVVDSPPSFSHLRIEVGGRSWHVLSAMRAAPPDASGRANKLAHHLVLNDDERADAGPAWMLRQPGVMIDRFEGPPRWITAPRSLPRSGPAAPRRAEAWERATGDAGWAGELANRFLLDASRIVAVVHEAGVDPLELIDEALSLLPPAARWRVTFATHFQQPIAGVPCTWRFCLRETPAAIDASRRATGLFLDLSDLKSRGARAGEGRYCELARSGSATWWSRDEDPDTQGAASRASMASATDRRDPIAGVDPESMDTDTRAETRFGRTGAASGGHSDSEMDRPRARRTSLVIGCALALAVGVGGGIAFERMLRTDPEPLAALREELAELSRDRTQLHAQVTELSTALRASEMRMVEAEAQRDRTLIERDAATARAEHAEAVVARYEAAARGDAAASHGNHAVAPSTGGGRAPAPSTAPAAPSSATADGAATGASSTPRPAPVSGPAAAPASTAGPESATPAAFDPNSVAPGAEIVVPAALLERRVSRLGVIVEETRRLATLRGPIASIAIEPDPVSDGVALKSGEKRTQVTLFASGGGEPRAMLSIEAEGAGVLLIWRSANSLQRHEAWLDQADAALARMTIVATLMDGSVQRLVAAPAEVRVEIPRSAPITARVPVRGSSLILSAIPSQGWTIEPASGDAGSVSLRAIHGVLRAALDARTGLLTLRFTSPVREELEAAEEELRMLERDRASVAPDERRFHEGRIEQLREQVRTLRARATSEAAASPASFPMLAIDDQTLGRRLVSITLAPAAPAARRSP